MCAYGCVNDACSLRRTHFGYVTGSVHTLSNPSALNFAATHSRAFASLSLAGEARADLGRQTLGEIPCGVVRERAFAQPIRDFQRGIRNPRRPVSGLCRSRGGEREGERQRANHEDLRGENANDRRVGREGSVEKVMRVRVGWLRPVVMCCARSRKPQPASARVCGRWFSSKKSASARYATRNKRTLLHGNRRSPATGSSICPGSRSAAARPPAARPVRRRACASAGS